MTTGYFQSSIGRKQIVAITGLLLIGYLIIHLAGNLFLMIGPEFFNKYAETLGGLRPGLTIIELVLLAIFLVHIYFTGLLVAENVRARGGEYKIKRDEGKRSLATRLMPYTGTFVLLFVIGHIIDFTLVDKHGPRSFLNGESYGLYGIVYNSFTNPLHSTLYIMAMIAIGFHLWHGLESLIQTFGWKDEKRALLIENISQWFAILLTTGFCSVPIYVMLHYYLN